MKQAGQIWCLAVTVACLVAGGVVNAEGGVIKHRASATAGYVGLGGGQVSLSSVTNQVFNFTETPMLADLTLYAQDPMGEITNHGTIRISVPADWACVFVTSNVVTLSGNAQGKIGTPGYMDSGRTLKLPVTADFAAGDTVVIAGLQLAELHLVPPGTKSLELDFDGDGARDVYDACTLTVQAIWEGGFFDGWDASVTPKLNGLGGALVSLSSGTTQTFEFVETPFLADLLVFAEEPQGAITNGGALRVSVPANWACRFDVGSAVTVSSNAAAKVGSSYFENNGRTLVLPVTADFANEDALVIAGLKLDGLQLVSPGTASLELDFDGDGVRDVYDKHALTVRALWPGGFYDGWDSGELLEARDLHSYRHTLITLH